MIARRRTTSAMRRWRGIALVVIVYLGLAAWYSLVIPPFESPDELHHMGYVVHLVREGALPIQRPGETSLFAQEGSQPPLYYLIAATLVSGVDLTDWAEMTVPNPYVRMGLPSAIENRNLVMHPPEGTPLRGSILALHMVRWLSILMGMATVLSTYQLVQQLLTGRTTLALAAAATTAFTPMFVFVSASANNDNLIILLASLTLVALARTYAQGVSISRLLALGALCGAALLTKLSGITLLALVLAALLAFTWRETAGVPTVATPSEMCVPLRASTVFTALRRWLTRAALLLAPTLVIAAWWYVRNLRLYSELTGVKTMLAIFGTRTTVPNLAQLLGELRGFFMSYWGIFGIFNVLMQPQVLYPALLGIGAVGLLGAIAQLVRAWQQKRRLPWISIGVVAAWPIALAVSLLRWTSMTYASQGRLVFPAISVLSLALAGGIAVWFRGRGRIVAYAGLPALLLVITFIQPWASIMPAYAPPESLRPEQIPSEAQPVHAQFSSLELLAAQIAPERVSPGGRLLVTLYWQAHATQDQDLTLYIHVQRDSFHGGGAYPTSYWKPGQIVHGTYAVDIAHDAAGPTAAEIVVGVYDRHTMAPITAVDPAGNPVGKLVVGRVKIAAETSPATPQWPADAVFGGAIALRGYDLDWQSRDGTGPLTITLHWEVIAPVTRDLTVFIHLVDAQDHILGQGDGPPCRGQYPTSYWPTSYWQAGEWLQDEHLIAVTSEPGDISDARILVGFYDPGTGERLPVTAPHGQSMGNYLIISPSPNTWTISWRSHKAQDSCPPKGKCYRTAGGHRLW